MSLPVFSVYIIKLTLYHNDYHKQAHSNFSKFKKHYIKAEK